MVDGLTIAVPAERARELGERVWDWAARNLFWLMRADPEALDWLDAGLPALAAGAAPLIPEGRLFALKGAAHADAQRAGRWLTLSALSLRPGLDELLGRYGARLAPRTPSLSRALAKCGVEDAPLVAQLGSAPTLTLAPNDPGEPARPTRFACVFHIDEWPLTAALEDILGVDPRVRACVGYFLPSDPGTPDVCEAIPEVDIPGADAGGMFALLARFAPLLWQKPLSWLGDAPSMKRGFHSSATKAEVEGFFAAQGFRLLPVVEVIAMHRAWSSVRHARAARVGHDPDPWTYPELWTEAFPPRSSAPERRRLRALARADQGVFRRASFPRWDPFDSFALVRDALMEAGMKRPEVFAAQVPTLLSLMHAGSNVWHLAAAIREDAQVRKALARAGFTRGHLEHVRRLLAGELHGRRTPALEMECAEIAAPEDLDAATTAVVRRGFPVLGARYAIHLDRCASSDGALTGELTLVRWNEEEQIDGLGGRTSILLTAEQRRSPSAAEALTARFSALSRLTGAEFDALFGDHQEDPFQPFVATVSPALAALVAELLPVTLTDGSELSIRRLEEKAEGLFATVVVTARDANGAVESMQEYGDRKILSAKEAKGKAARAALTRKVGRWKGASAEGLWGAFMG